MEFRDFRAAVLQARAKRMGRSVGQVVRFPGGVQTMPQKSRDGVVDWLLTYVGGAFALFCWIATCLR
jgi:hypothetical protein